MAGHETPSDRILSLDKPSAVYFEAYRRLYRQVRQIHTEKNLQCIGVTSADMSEGKTITTINLALTIAEDTRNRVALVDCDFRLPQVAGYLGLPARHGLADVVFGRANLNNIMVALKPPRDNLVVIPQGRVQTGEKEIYSVFYENRLDPVFAELRKNFDYVLVDTPPILAVADQQYLIDLLDGVLLVVRFGRTSRDKVKAALESTKAKQVIGVVCNDVVRQYASPYTSAYHYGNYGRYYHRDSQQS